jgi:ABC-2 type transport system permease protein
MMMAGELFLLEKTKLTILRNSIFRRGRGLTRLAVLSALGSLFVAGDYWFFYRMLVHMTSLPLAVGEILVIQLLNLLCLTFFSMLVFSNIITSISTMFMSRDLDLLISSPFGPMSVFISKALLTFINSSWMAAVFGVPIFAAYGKVYGAPWTYYAAFPAAMAPFLLIPSAVGIMVTLTLMRFFPARRTSQILSFIGLVFVAGLVMFFRFLQPEKFLGKKDIPEEEIVRFVEQLKTPDYGWMPSSMMAKTVKSAGVADWDAFVVEFAWLWIFAAIAVIFTLAAAFRFYYPAFSLSQGERERGAADSGRFFYRFLGRIISPVPLAARGMMMKDVKIFWRDAGQWSQLFMLGALIVVYIFNIRNLPLDTFFLKNLVSVANIGLAGVVLAAVASRFVFTTTSMEGASFWVVKSSPMSARSFLLAKFFLYLLPLMALAEILVVVSNALLGVDSFVMTVSAVAMAAMTLGITGLGVGMGAAYPTFDYENVAEVAVTTGAIAYMLVSVAFIGLMVIFVSGPVYEHLMSVFFRKSAGGAHVWLSYAGAASLTGAALYIPMRKGIQSLERMET